MPRERIDFRFEARMAAENVGEIMVYGYITPYPWDDEDMSARGFDKALKSLGDVDRLNIRINSGGGHVNEAVAMRAMLMNHAAREKHVYIEGICASAATLLATIGKVHMYEGARYMLHEPMTYAFGAKKDMQKTHDFLDGMCREFARMYSKRSGKPEDEIAVMMEKETWYTADEALKNGFVDEVIEAPEAVAAVDAEMFRAMRAMYKHTPAIAVADVMRESNIGHGEDIPKSIGNAVSPAAENKDNGSEETEMDMKDLTLDALMQERRDLYDQIVGQGVAQGIEREQARMEAIDRATVSGYEALAFEAKHGEQRLGAGEYALAVLAAQQQKGADFLKNRAQETQAAGDIPGSEAAVGDEDAEIDALARELAAFAPKSGREE